MPTVDELRGKHAGEDFIAIGCGSSLLNVPPAFLMSKRNIGVNFVPMWYPFLPLDYWLTLDANCMSNVKLIDEHRENLGRDTIVFLRPKHIDGDRPDEYVERKHWSGRDHVTRFVLDEVNGLSWQKDGDGVGYNTSLAAAAHAAIWMGAGRVFVVGFDCTIGDKGHEHIDKKIGLTTAPHFYDAGNGGAYRKVYDVQMGLMTDHARRNGAEIINLSKPTMARHVPKGNVEDYWTPGGYERTVFAVQSAQENQPG